MIKGLFLVHKKKKSMFHLKQGQLALKKWVIRHLNMKTHRPAETRVTITTPGSTTNPPTQASFLLVNEPRLWLRLAICFRRDADLTNPYISRAKSQALHLIVRIPPVGRSSISPSCTWQTPALTCRKWALVKALEANCMRRFLCRCY